MTLLDGFAILVLLVLLASAVVIVALLGSLPGTIARKRQHPHAYAVTVAGWVGLIFIVFWPLALIWAYLDVPQTAETPADADDLGRRVAALEQAIKTNRVQEAAE
jgi:hypothetical protein